MINRLELEIPQDTKEEKQQAFRYYSALHTLAISGDRQEIYLLLTENKMRYAELMAACSDKTVLGWLQGGFQLIDSMLELIDTADQKLNDLRTTM